MPSPYINRFLSADTIVPGYANPQSLNRYSYVLNNPLRFTDPSGHRPDDGCRTGEGCNVTAQTIIEDNKRANDFRNTTERNKCKAGNKNSCSYAENHPVETAAFVGGGLFLAGASPELAGGAYSILRAGIRGALWYGSYACLQNARCSDLVSGGRGIAVLGRWPKFVEIGIKLNANILNISKTTWTQGVNDRFVSEIANKSQTVFLTSEYMQNTATIFYGEVNQLISKGYTNFMDIFLFPPSG